MDSLCGRVTIYWWPSIQIDPTASWGIRLGFRAALLLCAGKSRILPASWAHRLDPKDRTCSPLLGNR